MEVTNKINNITLHHVKTDNAMSYEGEMVDYVLYSRALGNAEKKVIKLYLNYKI